MATEGYTIEHGGKTYVGAEDKSRAYRGPQAEVYVENGTWLRIVADKYDNTLMLNVETAEHLIRAIRKAVKKAAKK